MCGRCVEEDYSTVAAHLVGSDELGELILQAAVNGAQPLAVIGALGGVKQASATGIPSLHTKITVMCCCVGLLPRETK